MKICHMTSVHDSMDDRIFMREAAASAQAGYDTYIVAPGKTFVSQGVKIEGIGRWSVSRLQRMLVITEKIYQKALKINADIYQLHDPELLPIGKKLKKQGKIVIYDSHEDVPRQILAKEWLPLPVRKGISKYYERYEKNIAKKIDCVITATPHISEVFKKAGAKTCVVRNYPLLKDIHGENDNYFERNKAICYAGGLTEQRGITELVKAMQHVDARLMLAGKIEKEYFHELEKMSGFEKVDMQGFLKRKGIEDMYNKSRIGMAVLQRTPNHINALAIKLFEYMAAGIPIICSDFPLWREIVEQNGCGFCVNPEDTDQISEKICTLLDNQKLAKAMGDAGKKVVKSQYNWENEKEHLLNLYDTFDYKGDRMNKRVCTRCVMSEEGDPQIQFDEIGVCNYCKTAEEAKKSCYFPDESGKKYLETLFSNMKTEKKDEKYDCMIGLSGGLDSSYLAYVGYKYGLRMLAVHIDDGFDTEITKRNVKRICESFGIDLITEHPDKEQFADLTKAFIRAGVPDIAIPQDNVLFATLYKYAEKNKITYFLSGSNFALESILQKGNGYDASDKVHIKDIHKKFGDLNLKKDFPLISSFEKKFKYGYIHKIQTLTPLNYMDYNASRAMDELQEACGFEYYGDKHCESIFTKFMQRFYLPEKFNVDKRKSHYSSMILVGQMSRDEALTKLKEPLYKEEDLNHDKKFVLDYLQMSDEEFEKLMAEPPKSHDMYKKSIVNQLAHLRLKIRKH